MGHSVFSKLFTIDIYLGKKKLKRVKLLVHLLEIIDFYEKLFFCLQGLMLNIQIGLPILYTSFLLIPVLECLFNSVSAEYILYSSMTVVSRYFP